MAYALITSDSKAGTPTGVTTDGVDTTGADLIVVNVGWYSNGGLNNTLAVSDSEGNTWTALTIRSTTNIACRLFYVYNPSVGAGHTFTANDGANSPYPSIEMMAFSGAAAAPFDQQNGATATATSIATGSITPTEDNELVVAGLAHENNSAGAVSINGGFTALKVAYVGGNSQGSGLARLIQTTATAANPTWSITTSAESAAVIASFKAASGGGGNRRRRLLICG
jgi:hypothetical protein